LRFAVRRPVNPVASPRSHGVPRRDVLGRVHVSVKRQTAGYAAEEGLALAALRCDVPARRAALARERGIDPFDPAGGLLPEAAYQQSPTRPHNLTVEPGFLTDFRAGFPCRPFGRARHIRDVQVLDADRIEPVRETGGSLLGPVLASVGLTGFQPGDRVHDSRSSVRASGSPRQPALEMAEPVLPAGTKPGNPQQLARRQCRAHSYAAVDADNLAVTWRGDGGWDRGEGDMPASRAVARDPVRPHVGGYGTGPAKAHPTDLWYPHPAGPATGPTNVLGFNADNPETFITPGFAPGRPAVRSRKEICHRLGEVPQRLLLYHLAAAPEPTKLGACVGKLAALLQVARSSAAPGTPPGLLLNGEVPYEAGVRAMVSQHCLLSGRRYQAVTRHSNVISKTISNPEEVKRRVLPGLKSETLTPQP
jgi:hypothetical protein